MNYRAISYGSIPPVWPRSNVRRVSRYAGIAIGILLGASFMRVYHLGERSLWMDEAFSLFGAWPPLRQALSVLIADGVHPPFYYLVQKASFAIGNSELALRWPSAMFGVLAVAAVARLGREWFGWSTGLFAGALLALSPFAVHALPPDLEIDESNPEIKAWLAMLEPALLERIDFPGVALFLYDLDAKEAAV